MAMPLKEQILDLIAASVEMQTGVAAVLPESERRRTGRADAWAPKDVLLHLAGWTEDLARRLAGDGESTVPRSAAEIDEANRARFDANAGVPWEDVVPTIEAVHAGLADIVRGLGDEDLRSTTRYAWQQDQPVWGSITGSVIVHPVMHLAQILIEQGRREAAHELQEDAARRLDALDDAPRWRGVVRYNLACHFALAGERERALGLLAEALSLHPGLREWSREDSDLVSLHGDPEFERRTAEAVPPNLAPAG
jgi:tetratricopeptide (TPR) repeat protein